MNLRDPLFDTPVCTAQYNIKMTSLRNIHREDGGHLGPPGLGSGLPAGGPLPRRAGGGGPGWRHQVHRPGRTAQSSARARGHHWAGLAVQIRTWHPEIFLNIKLYIRYTLSSF